MSTPIALPTMFRARALAAAGVPWVEDGVHFRVRLNPWIGFPIHPFAGWRITRLGGDDDVPIVWRNANGKTATMPFKIEDQGGELFGTLQGATASDPWIWIDLEVNDGGVRVDLLDGKLSAGKVPRVLTTRSREPFRFGESEITHLRVTGRGEILGARGMRASRVFVEGVGEQAPDFVFGLPLESAESRAWYAPDPHQSPRDAAVRRVWFGAPRHLSPPDNPSGVMPDDSDKDAEADRIMSVVGPQLVDPWLGMGFDDAGTPPVSALWSELGQTTNGKRLAANAPVTPSLLTMAVDPQIARYLGLATAIDSSETPAIERFNVWLIASRWAVQLSRPVVKFADWFGSSIPLGSFLGSAATAGFLNSTLDAAFPDAPAIVAGLPGVPDRDGSGPWSAVTLMTLAVAPGDAPSDPPDAFELFPDEPGAWNAQADPEHPGPESWRQSISLGNRPARGMVGFARMSPGAPAALQQVVPPPGQRTSRVLPLVPSWASNNKRLVTDRTIPPDPAGASWQVWQADEFGQWSNGAPLSQPLPARPLPPPPVGEVTYAARPDDGSATPRIPGSLHLRLEVPAESRMAPGSMSIKTLDISVDGAGQALIGVAAGDRVERDFEPKPFGVGEHRPVTVVATYTDSEGRTSPQELIGCDVFDARAPQAIPTSPVLIWTGQPDATGHAELALRWPPRAGAARYRVYLGDARRLATAAGIELADNPVRATSANPLHAAGASFADKHLFTFLGEASTTSPDGTIQFSTQIPGSLRGLQFVRVVPLSQGGAEAPFDTCGLVPCAVPGIDRPPTPVVETGINPAVGITVTVRARGLRPELVAAGAGKPPEYRIRRTRKPGADRAYAPIRTSGALTGPDDGVWSASFVTPLADVEPFVRFSWFAEVRYPSEPPIPPGMVPLPVDGGVEPVWSSLGTESEMVWSDLSLAAESLVIPAEGPAPPVAPTVTRQADGTNLIQVAGLPVAAAGAIGEYQLEIYRVQTNAPPRPVPTPPLGGAEVAFTDSTPATPNDDYDLVLVDPIGRRSTPTRAQPLP